MNSAGAFVSRNLRWALEAIHRVSLTLILTLIITLTLTNPYPNPRWIASSIHHLPSSFIGIRSASYDWQMRPRYPQTADRRDNAKNTEKSIRRAPLVKRG